MSRVWLAAIVVSLQVCLLVSAGTAQKRSARASASPPSTGKLLALKVTGTTRYTDKEILAASGLQIGQPAADGDFKEALQRLGESGMFSDLAFTYTTSATGVKLELQLTDVDQSKLVPAQFDNFVWFTDDQLLTVLQNRVPLFKQLLPLTGDLPDRVSESLQALLSEKSLPGRVNYLREGDATGGPLKALAYTVEEVAIRIRGFDFPGASPELTPVLTTAARRAIGAKYERSALAAIAQLDFLPVYLQRGYLKAEFAPSNARVVSPLAAPDSAAAPLQDDPAEIQVDAIVPVTPGKVYSTSAVDWKGSSAIATSEVAALLHLTPGQPADAVRLLADLESVGKLYRQRGYMKILITPDAQLDDQKSTVHYTLNIVEGDLYKMGELEILGLDTQATARMRTAWTLREGEPYNADYPRKYLIDTGQIVPRGVDWHVTTHETLDPKDGTVDVEIRFKQ